jgi:phage protein U
MFAVLGEIVFETLTAPNSLRCEHHWNYVEQRVIADLPRLQWIGDGLEAISLEMQFHISFCSPTVQVMALETAAADHQARALVFGNGDHRGYFVISSLEMIAKQMSDAGDLLAATVRVELKQWALASEVNPALPPLPSFTPIAVVAASVGDVTGIIAYSEPSGVSSVGPAPIAAYLAPSLAAVGVSPLLANPMVAGITVQRVPDDVLTSAIVRAAT